LPEVIYEVEARWVLEVEEDIIFVPQRNAEPQLLLVLGAPPKSTFQSLSAHEQTGISNPFGSADARDAGLRLHVN
jgi:hypothetical protein